MAVNASGSGQIPPKHVVVIRTHKPGEQAARLPVAARPGWVSIAALTGFSLYVIGVVLYTSAWQWICTLLLALGWAGVLWWERRRWWDVLKVMLVAFVLGAVGEWICVRKFDLWKYHFPTLSDGVPVWIGLVWGYLYAVYILIAEVFNAVWQRFGELLRNLLTIVLGIAFFLFLRAVFQRIDVHIAYYYVLFLAVGLALWRSPMDAMTLIVAGLGGTFGEYMAIQNGLWTYPSPVFADVGMPISLPLAWGLAGVFVRNAAAHFWHSILWLLVGTGLLCAAVRLVG